MHGQRRGLDSVHGTESRAPLQGRSGGTGEGSRKARHSLERGVLYGPTNVGRDTYTKLTRGHEAPVVLRSLPAPPATVPQRSSQFPNARGAGHLR